MKFPTKYNCLSVNSISDGDYTLIPIRYEDRLDILKWRNEQMYHLRQAERLTKNKQDNYFKNVVSKLFGEQKPNQILFSFLKNEELIGYGGLVHINWIDNHAEISFIMNTELQEDLFEEIWSAYLNLFEKYAFLELKLHKLFVYAFNLRPHLYVMLEKNNFYKEAVLKEHCLYEGKYIDVIIHSKINEK
jgi:RimJ/RimL family protein N-acetyltransferase